MGSEPREVLADFMNQGHLTYRVAGRVSDYDCADAMIRDLAAEGVAIIPCAEIESLRASLTRAEESDAAKTREINLLVKENRELHARLSRASVSELRGDHNEERVAQAAAKPEE